MGNKRFPNEPDICIPDDFPKKDSAFCLIRTYLLRETKNYLLQHPCFILK